MLINYPLKELNSWKVGGSCKEFASPSLPSEAGAILSRSLKDKEAYYILGGGTNVLIQDGLIDALVLSTARLDRFSAEEKGGYVELEVQAGCPVKKLLALAVRNGLGGFEFLAGIPGTLGGAIWGNAGARGAGFSGLVREVETIEADGGVRGWSGRELNWEYRSCPFDAGGTVLITRARLAARYAEASSITEKIRLFSSLKKGQPIGRKTAGCVFKNPPGLSAGRLLDTAGCKGMRMGGAIVSASHANFVENEKDATARDIYELCEKCRSRVFESHGIRLEYEIRFFGEF